MSYHNNIRELEALRSMSIHCARDASGLALLKKYYAQLYSLRNRFRMSRDENILDDLAFSWREMYSDKIVEGDINYEMLSILLNIGILFVELGGTDTRSTDSSMKTCCGYFQCAAYAFDQINEQTAQTGVYRSKDMSHDVVSFMYSLAMAQGQECILEKSICDSRKAGIIAKIAAQVSEYYSSCIMILLQSSLSVHHYSVQDVVGSREFKNWKKYCEFKISYFSSLSSFFMGLSCSQSQKTGESIAWFNSCHERLSEATKHCKGIDRQEWTSAMTEAVKNITQVINKKSEAAKKENDFIFHEMIPSQDKLTAVKGASLVKPIPFSVSDPEVIGHDIFGQLVPLEAHVTTSVYSDKKDKLLRDIGLKIEEKNEDLESFLSALNLPMTSTSVTTVSLRPKISPLPDELIDICAVLSLKEQFLEKIQEKVFSLDKKSGHVDSLVKNIQRLIDEEKVAEVDLQKSFGKRAESTLISSLEKDLQEKRDRLSKAIASDLGIKTSFSKCLHDLEGILKHHKSAKDLNSLLPEPGDIPFDEDNIKRLEEIINKVNEMKRQRIQLEEELKEAVRKDDVLSKVLMMTDDQTMMESMFQEELKKFDKNIELINMNLSAQENIKAALIKANADYAPTRKAIMEVEKKRSERIKEMVNSYETVVKIESSAETALVFYDRLTESLLSLECKVKSVCRLQSEERAKHVKKPSLENMNAMASALPGSSYCIPSTSSAPKLKDYLINRPSATFASNVSYPPSTAYYQEPPRANTAGYATGSLSYPSYSHYSSPGPQTTPVMPSTAYPSNAYHQYYSHYNATNTLHSTSYPGQEYSQSSAYNPYVQQEPRQEPQQPSQVYSSAVWQQDYPSRTTTDLLSDPLENFDQNPVLSPTPVSSSQ